MKKDINFRPVEGVTLTVAKIEDDWQVYLLNRSDKKLDTIFVTSKGYGEKDGEEQKTSTLRHAIPFLEPGMYAKIETIQSAVFHLTNEYWLSYYIGDQIYDKKFLFVPDSIVEDNLVEIPELGAQGVLHD